VFRGEVASNDSGVVGTGFSVTLKCLTLKDPELPFWVAWKCKTRKRRTWKWRHCFEDIFANVLWSFNSNSAGLINFCQQYVYRQLSSFTLVFRPQTRIASLSNFSPSCSSLAFFGPTFSAPRHFTLKSVINIGSTWFLPRFCRQPCENEWRCSHTVRDTNVRQGLWDFSSVQFML